MWLTKTHVSSCFRYICVKCTDPGFRYCVVVYMWRSQLISVKLQVMMCEVLLINLSGVRWYLISFGVCYISTLNVYNCYICFISSYLKKTSYQTHFQFPVTCNITARLLFHLIYCHTKYYLNFGLLKPSPTTMRQFLSLQNSKYSKFARCSYDFSAKSLICASKMNIDHIIHIVWRPNRDHDGRGHLVENVHL